MIVHLVTDRLRLADPAAGEGSRRECLIRQIEYAVAADVDVVQIRERDLDAGPLAALVRDAVVRARGTRTRIVVNDRVDVALACGAGGVHLRSDSVLAAVVRAMAPDGFLIGRSVHSIAAAVAGSADTDYLIAGAVWPTGSKPEGHPLLGVDGFAAIAAAVTVPVLAIGGVEAARTKTLREAGAAGMAGIGLFFDRNRSGCRAVPLAEVVAALRA